MAGRPTSGIGSSSTSSTPTLSDSTMPSIDSVGIQNPSSALPPKPKKSEQTSMVWEHFTKVEGVIPRILNHNASIVRNCLAVTVKG